MSDETLFYVLGLVLVAIALVVSFVGIRFDKFPTSRGVLVGGTVAITALVLATMTFAWRNAEDEQAHKEAELAEAAEESAAEGEELQVQEQVGQEAEQVEEQADSGALAAEGAEIFATVGCAGCHTLADAGSTGTTGPDLDGALQGKDEAYIRTAIIDPNDFIARNYPPNVMPQTYGEDFAPEEIDALVAYLVEATGGGSG
jgi:mono/diheme cytochrome c family protein